MEGYRPAYSIKANGSEITPTIADRLLSLRFEEVAEDEADELVIRLDERPTRLGYAIELPEVDTLLELSLGYENNRVLKGKFRVDEIRLTGPPRSLEVRASSAAFSKAIRSAKTRTWHYDFASPQGETSPEGYTGTLGSMAEIIGREHGLDVQVDPQLADQKIPHQEQQHQSDLAFLNKQAEFYDAVAKPVGDAIVVAKKAKAEAPSGVKLPAYRLRPRDVVNYTYTHRARRAPGADNQDGGGVKAYWYDYDAGERRSVKVGPPPYEEVKHLHQGVGAERKARAKAEAEYNASERRKKEFTFTMPGKPQIVAEGKISLTGWQPMIPTEWRVVRVEHAISNNGYTTSATCEVLNSG